MSIKAALTEPAAKPTTTDNPHVRLAEEIRLKHPECIPPFRALLNREIAERKLKEVA